jgi:AAA domain
MDGFPNMDGAKAAVSAAQERPTVEPIPALAELLSVRAWTERDIPAADRLLGDLVTTTSRIFLVGRTGLGKTLLGLAMAIGVALGRGFLHWRSARPARVLYLDGEMPAELIRQRAIDALRREGVTDCPGLFIFGRDLDEEVKQRFPLLGEMPALNTEAGHNWLLALIEALGGVDLVIFDNVMSLLEGVQKEEEAWSGALPLVQALTHRSIGQVWLDHTGHDSSRQYGSSTKAWRFDAVGIMAPLSAEEADRDATAFTLSFDHPGKARRRTPDNWRDFETVTVRLKDDHWTAQPTTSSGTRTAGKVSPSRVPYYDALVAAITASANATPGTTTLFEWQTACQRRGLIEPPREGEDYRERGARFVAFRRAKAELIGARWISVEETTVTDLKGRWT